MPVGMSSHSQSFDGTTAKLTVGDIVAGEHYTGSLTLYTGQQEFNHPFVFTDAGLDPYIKLGAFSLTASVGTLAVTTP